MAQSPSTTDAMTTTGYATTTGAAETTTGPPGAPQTAAAATVVAPAVAAPATAADPEPAKPAEGSAGIMPFILIAVVCATCAYGLYRFWLSRQSDGRLQQDFQRTNHGEEVASHVTEEIKNRDHYKRSHMTKKQADTDSGDDDAKIDRDSETAKKPASSGELVKGPKETTGTSYKNRRAGGSQTAGLPEEGPRLTSGTSYKDRRAGGSQTAGMPEEGPIPTSGTQDQKGSSYKDRRAGSQSRAPKEPVARSSGDPQKRVSKESGTPQDRVSKDSGNI
jgi:hypothetical protein